ncbi:abortive infection protein, partial [Micromonospora globispora]
WEATLFLGGIVAGATAADRTTTLTSPPRLLWSTLRHGPFPWALNRHLRRAVATARARFAGPLTYAALSFESVGWRPFDVVGVDHYRSGEPLDAWAERIAERRRHGKPVVLTELGCATYAGAAARGALAWTVVDRGSDPPRLREPVVRNERAQAEEVGALLDAAETAGADAVFVFTYAAFSYPHRPEPEHDLDTAGYGLMAVLPDGSLRRKAAFDAVARRFTAR